MRNILVKGVEIAHEAEIPIDADWVFSAIVKSYNQSTGVVQVEAVWDQAGAGQKKIFYCWAKYLGLPGTPTANEVVVGQETLVCRVGKHNATGPFVGLAIDSEDTDKASFIAFFFAA